MPTFGGGEFFLKLLKLRNYIKNHIKKLKSWNIGRLEDWKVGRFEGWNVGRLEGWKVGRLEGWNVGRLEGWKVGRLEGWKVGRLDGKKVGMLECSRGCISCKLAFVVFWPPSGTSCIVSEFGHQVP